MSEVKDGMCIIDAISGIDCATLQIGQFTDNFDKVKFLLGKDFNDYTMIIVTDINGHVEIVNTDGESLVKESTDGETSLVWNIGANITSESGVVIYQLVAYKKDNEEIEEVWYSKEGRLIVTESISTNEYSTSLIGSYPNLLTRLLIDIDTFQKELETKCNSKVDAEEGMGLSKNSFSDEEKEKLSAIEEGAEVNVASDWQEDNENSDSYIRNKPSLAKVAISGSYTDLKDKPMIDDAYNPESQNAQSGTAVAEAIANLVNSSPEALNTLYELANALGNDPNFAETIAKEIGTKVDKEDGKELSSNDYTDAEKEKLASVAQGAEKNVISDWEEEDANSDKFIKNKPLFSAVATSGSYNDLSDKPIFSKVVSSGSYNDLSDKPMFSQVAFSGSYDDLTDTPQIPSVEGLASEDYVSSALDGLASEEYVNTGLEEKAEKAIVNETLADIESLEENKADILKLETETAKAIKVADASNQKIDSLTMYGEGEGVENPTIKIYGKNFIPFPYVNMSVTHNGITFTVNDDGTVTANGTATAQAYIVISNKSRLNLVNGTYCLSGTPSENNEDHKCYMTYSGTPQDGRTDGSIIVIDDTVLQNNMTCVVSSGKTVNNFVFKPMLEVGTTVSEFELYKVPQSVSVPYVLGEGDTLTMSNRTVKTNIGGNETDITDTETGKALLELHTNYPNTTVLCDCETKVTYKADTTVAYNKLKEAILSLGGNI